MWPQRRNVGPGRRSAGCPSPVTLPGCRFSPGPRRLPGQLYYPVHGEEAGPVGGECQLHAALECSDMRAVARVMTFSRAFFFLVCFFKGGNMILINVR